MLPTRAWLMLAGVLGIGCGRIDFSALPDADGSDGRGSDVGSDGPLTPAWQLIQVNGNSSASGVSSLAVSEAPTGAGHVLVVGIQFEPGGSITSISDNATSAPSLFAELSGTAASNPTSGDALIMYVSAAAHAGATTLTVATSSLTYAVVVWEFATTGTISPDVEGNLSSEPASTLPSSPIIDTTHAGDLIVAISIAANSIQGIHAGNDFTNDLLTNGNGWAHITSAVAAAGTQQAQWDSSLGTYCSDIVAFHVDD
jgi:hypothetical protein